MARVPQVTRTIQTTRADVLCLNINDGCSFTKSVVLPRTYKDENTMLKCAENLINTDEVKAVHIVSHTVEETLYGMSEQKFIELADVMPPRKGNDGNGSEGATC